jgi:hypothetical protein
MAEHYVNNKEFVAALLLRAEEIKQFNKPTKKTNDFVGKCIIDIANRVSYMPNFRNYTFRSEMVLDGIENAYRYIDRFDPTVSVNAFAYFTENIFWTFVRRIKKEKQQMLIKARLINSASLKLCDLQEQDEDLQFVNGYLEFLQDQKVYDKMLEADEKKKLEKKMAAIKVKEPPNILEIMRVELMEEYNDNVVF